MASRLLILDPQVGWARRHVQVESTFRLLANWLTVHDLWPRVWITAFYNDEASPFRRLMARWTDFQSAEDWTLLEPYATRTVEVIRRNTYGLPEAFWQTARLSHVDRIVLAGVETDASVCKTAMDAFDRGIGVDIVPSWTASAYGSSGRAHGLAILRKVLGSQHVITEEEALKILRSG
ncbi:putative amidase [Sulfobacillus acidophilus TPY]|uniref:Amidase n=1 Tax=Sulfobacillus acidophilus (strain ATCC 700253 / DSM 10332 / NAL) TaxID=679936 RepID=G8TZT5_SULAD|nr:putative amidase [Sulfobacillus acidophilus TPY]AEW06415.1 putative amidase [Sulfobacillus acidophilus DSM 10332]